MTPLSYSRAQGGFQPSVGIPSPFLLLKGTVQRDFSFWSPVFFIKLIKIHLGHWSVTKHGNKIFSKFVHISLSYSNLLKSFRGLQTLGTQFPRGLRLRRVSFPVRRFWQVILSLLVGMYRVYFLSKLQKDLRITLWIANCYTIGILYITAKMGV